MIKQPSNAFLVLYNHFHLHGTTKRSPDLPLTSPHQRWSGFAWTNNSNSPVSRYRFTDYSATDLILKMPKLSLIIVLQDIISTVLALHLHTFGYPSKQDLFNRHPPSVWMEQSKKGFLILNHASTPETFFFWLKNVIDPGKRLINPQ